LSVFDPVIRIVPCRVMREDRSPSAGASREYHNERGDPDCEPPATYRTTPKRTTDARRPVRSNVAHTDGRPASPSGFAVIPGGDHMFKRILMLVALGVALVACGSGTASTPGTETLAPIDSAAPSDSGLPSESASPS
jgi:hypothetical protein